MHRFSFHAIAIAVFFGGASLASAAVSINSVGVYDENTTVANSVDTSANAAPNDLATFTAAVLSSYSNNRGGVVNFDISANTTDTIISASYGTALSKVLNITSSKTLSLQTVTSSTAISGSAAGNRVALLGTNTNNNAAGNDFTLTFSSTITGGEVGEAVTSAGLTALSRNTTGYPLSVTITANFSSGAPQVSTFNLGNTSGTNDTFVGFTAPADAYITSLAFDMPNAPTGSDTRLIFDDLAFVTSIVPEPATGLMLAIPGLMLLARRRR